MVDAILGQVFQNLSSLIQDEISLLWGFQEDLKRLSNTVSAVRIVIEDAEMKQHSDKMIANWLRQLKDAAYDADDVLDEWSTEVRLSQINYSNSTCIKQVSVSFLACFPLNQIAFRHKIAKRIGNSREQFDHMVGEMSKFKLISAGFIDRGALLDPTRETSSMIFEPQVYGRDEDKDKVVDMLIDNASSNQKDVSFLSILGIGGLGKTTLAQLIYNDERVSEHFAERIWVCVGENFSVQNVIKLIIESLSGKAPDLKSLEALQNEVKRLLSGKRFLLVLDDVWNEDQNEWNKLKSSLTCGAKGSATIVTTRLDSVASIMDDALSVVYRLCPLSEDECWSLFKGHAFCVGEDLCTNLIGIGKQIVKRCEGVPLAVKVLGGLMRSKREVREWESIRDSDFWELAEEKGSAILGVLRLSYNHLRPQLKRCFSYCSLFPKDYVMYKEKLIHLWMANDYIQSVTGMELEDIGNQIFDELLQGSFFQDVGKDKLGNILTCKMHDLMHDLACHLTVSECCPIKFEKETMTPKNMRHLLLITPSRRRQSSSSCEALCKSNKSLRTLVYPFAVLHPSHMNFQKLNYLRVLDMSHIRSGRLPSSLGHMKCLRYLNLSYMVYLKSLPKSICRLIQLQTLKLVGCEDLQMLPKDMKSMSHLRHLDIRGCDRLSEMPSEMGQMTCLRMLSIFIVGQKNGRKINELKGLNHLGGQLKLKRLELVEDSIEARESNLVSKQNLSSLELSWGYDCGLLQNSVEEVLECLRPHSGVKKLVLDGYPGAQFSSWMKSLSNLVVVELRHCVGIKTLPPLGQLLRLKFLTIQEMFSVEYIGIEFYGKRGERGIFSSLENLCLKGMPNLERWEGRNGEFPNLHEFEIGGCPKLETLAMLPNWVKLQTMEIGDMMVLNSLRNLHGLTALRIYMINDLVSFPRGCLQNLTALKSLSIEGCRKLKTIPDEIGNLTALTSLRINWCHELISLPAEGLQKLTSLDLSCLDIRDCRSLKSLPEMGIQRVKNSLVKLVIKRCYSLTCLELRYLSSLQTLEIGHYNQLELSKEAFQHLVSLQDLTLHALPKMTSVPDVQNLTALQSLRIWGCPNVRRLPQGLQHLTSLQTLDIMSCHPDLHKRIQRRKGEDWTKISHIPNLDVAYRNK